METEGTVFVDIEKQDINRKKKSGSIIAALIFSIILLATLIPSVIVLFKTPSVKIIGVVLLFILLGLVIGIFAALIQRIKEINGGEEYEARKY